jgi:undecaprenyl-diphosphatase
VHTWQAVILGLVEGFTEYLPISSTGHLILAEQFLGLLDDPASKDSLDAFTVVIQGGAILAVAGLYAGAILKMLRGLIGRDPVGLRMLVNLVIAFIPSAALGLLLDKAIDRYLFHTGPVVFALAAGGVYMLAVDQWRRGRFGLPRHAGRALEIERVTPGQALFIGLLQCFSLWPGTSRSMMTITGGMLVGLPAGAAAEFSFLLGLPTLVAATLYKLYKNLKVSHAEGRPDFIHELGGVQVAVGVLVAAVAAAIAVRWLVGFLNRRGLTPFGWYRLALAILIVGLSTAGHRVFSHETGPRAAEPAAPLRP